jgi:hypothetical protein
VKRLVLAVLGAMLGLLGLALMGAGALVLSLFGTDGQTQVPVGEARADTGRAIVLTDFQISTSTPLPFDESWFDLQVEVAGDQQLFVGVAAKTDSLEYLRGVPYLLITGIDSSSEDLDSTQIPGDSVPAAPAQQTFWTDQGQGRDVAVDWPVTDSNTTLVVMNADGSPPVAAEISARVTVGWASPAAIGTLIAGLVVIGVAIFVLVVAFRSQDPQHVGSPTSRA